MSERLDWERLDGLLREPYLRQLAALAAAGNAIVLVGGALRDALLGRDPQDVDLVAEQDLERVIDKLAVARGLRPASIGDDFQNTHRFRWHGRSIDIAAVHESLEADLARRDFTINAMALRLPVETEARAALIDPHGGLRDLEHRRLRPVSPATIAADPLRVMRGIRYAGDLPGFALGAESRATLQANAPALATVARERVSNEWQAILASSGWHHAVESAWELGVGGVTLGDRRTDAGARAWSAQAARGGADDGVEARLAAVLFDLDHDGDPDALSDRLVARRWPKRLARTAARAACWAGRRVADRKELARWALRDPRAATMAGRLAQAVGTGVTSSLCRLADRAREPRWVTGADLRRLGMLPGPEVGAILAEAAEGQVLRTWADAAEAREWAADRARGRT